MAEISGGTTYSTGIVSKPVDELGLARLTDAGKIDAGTICQSSLINMWSRYKPFNSNTLFFKQDTDATKTDRDDALKAANYGIATAVKTTSNYQLKFNNIHCFNTAKDAALYGYWKYTERKTPFRLSDFIGYDSKAAAPATGFDEYQATPVSVTDIEEKVVKFSCGANISEGGDNIGLSDIASSIYSTKNTNLYLCCGFLRNSDNKLVWRTANAPLKDGGIEVSFLFNGDCGAESGEHTIYWCLSTIANPYSQTSQVTPNYTFIPMPFGDPTKAVGKAIIKDTGSGSGSGEGGSGGTVVVSPGIEANMFAAGDENRVDRKIFSSITPELNISGNVLIVGVKIKSTYIQSQTIRFGTVKLQLGDYSANGTVYNIQEQNITDLAIAANATVEIMVKANGIITQLGTGVHEDLTMTLTTTGNTYFNLQHPNIKVTIS